jgi:hypothetical protein
MIGQRFGKTKVAKNNTSHARKANQNAAALGKAGRIVRFSTITPSSAKSNEVMTSQIFGGWNVITNSPSPERSKLLIDADLVEGCPQAEPL